MQQANKGKHTRTNSKRGGRAGEQLAPWPLRLQLQQHVQRPTHAQDMEYVMWVYDSVREGRFISAIIS